MTNLATLRGGGGEGGSTNKSKLPVFCVWSNPGNNGFYTIFNGAGGCVGSGSNTTNGEMWSAFTGTNYTSTSSFSTNTYGSTSTNGMTQLNQAEGHYAQNVSNTGVYQGLTQKNASGVAGIWSRFGVTINSEGIRQKNSLYVSGTTARVYPFGGLSQYETFNWTTYANVSGTPGNTTDGMISYNDRIKTLVIVTGNSSANYRIHVWKHPNYGLDGTDFSNGSLIKFMNDARNNLNGGSYFYNDFSWNTSSATSYTESMYHMRIVLGDNNIVGLVRFTPSNQTVNGFMTLQPLTTSTTVTTGTTLSVTTSYGIDQGALYGMRHQLSWDNNWVVAYSPYYYYGCGAKMYFIYTPDPTKYYTYSYDDTSNGVGIAPTQENKFIWSYHSANNDGNVGLQAGIISPQQLLDRNVSVGTTTPSNTGNGWLDTGTSSTNYSHLLAMSSWSSGNNKS